VGKISEVLKKSDFIKPCILMSDEVKQHCTNAWTPFRNNDSNVGCSIQHDA